MLKWFADRLAETGKDVRKDQRGFTLIELLVVVIIIGILAAIAIPTFLNQRDNAEQASVVSDARNAATEVQSWGAERGGDYSTLDESAFADVEWSNGNSVDAASISGDSNSFSFTVNPGNGDLDSVTYDSADGGIEE